MKKIIVLLLLSQPFISFGQYNNEVLRMPATWGSTDTLSFNLSTQDTADIRKLKAMNDYVSLIIEKYGQKSPQNEIDDFRNFAPIYYTQHAVGLAVTQVMIMLKYPTSLEFLPKRGDIYALEDRILISFYIRAENGFGNMVTREVLCSVDSTCTCQLK